MSKHEPDRKPANRHTQPTSTRGSSIGSSEGGAAVQLKASLRGHDYATQVQMLAPDGGPNDSGPSVHEAAAHGTASGGGKLPNADKIQKSFGGYDISNIQAHLGSAANEASSAMGANAYATGNHVVLGENGNNPHTAAHEAAHVVQQDAGVSLSGGVGKANDAYEQHANLVADRVVQGKSAEDLLGQISGGGGGSSGGVQREESKDAGSRARATKDASKDREGVDTCPLVLDVEAVPVVAQSKATSARTTARDFANKTATLPEMLRNVADHSARLRASSQQTDAALDDANTAINFRGLSDAIGNFGHMIGSLASVGKIFTGTLFPKLAEDAAEAMSGRFAHAFALIDVGSGLFKNGAGTYAALGKVMKSMKNGPANAEMGAVRAVKDHADESNAVASHAEVSLAILTLKELGGQSRLVREDLVCADSMLSGSASDGRNGTTALVVILNEAANHLEIGAENILACSPEILAISVEAPHLAATTAPSRDLVEWVSSDVGGETKNASQLELIAVQQKRIMLAKRDTAGVFQSSIETCDEGYALVPKSAEALERLAKKFVQLPFYREPTFYIPDDLAALLLKVNCPLRAKDGLIVEAILAGGRRTKLEWTLDEYMQDQESKNAELGQRLEYRDRKELY